MANGALPERVNQNAGGEERLQHSWRAALIPYLVGSEEAGQYRFSERWDSENNRKVAKAVDSFSTFAGDTANAYFFAFEENESEQVRGCGSIRVVSIPATTQSWCAPIDVTYSDVWDAIRREPDLVLLGINGGCVIRLGRIVKSKE